MRYQNKLASGVLRYEAVEFKDVQVRSIGTVGLLMSSMTATVSGHHGNTRVMADS